MKAWSKEELEKKDAKKGKINIWILIVAFILGLFTYIIFTGGLGGYMSEESFEALTHENAKKEALEAEKEACGARIYKPGKHVVFLEFKSEYYTIEVPDGYDLFDTKYASNAWSGTSSIVYLRNVEEVEVEGEYHENYMDKYKCSYNHFGIVKEDE